MELRASALKVLCISDPTEKVQALQSLWAMHTSLPLDTTAVFDTPGLVVPGRPIKPVLCPPHKVPTRSVHTDAGLAAMVHAICHIEFNAINLALDAIWRYPQLPQAYYLDWFKVAHEESTHFVLLHDLLQHMGHAVHRIALRNAAQVELQACTLACAACGPIQLQARVHSEGR